MKDQDAPTDCVDCREYIGTRRSHLWDDDLKRYRCTSCWDKWIGSTNGRVLMHYSSMKWET